MANITDPTAVRFSNEKIRPAADTLAQAYYLAKTITNEWNAVSMATLIPNTSDAIIDGSAEDGRNEITGIMATNIINRLNEFVADYELWTNAKLNTVLQVAVNVR